MMCSLFLRDEKNRRHGRLYTMVEHVFNAVLASYERGLDFVLRHRFATLIVFCLTVVASGYLYVVVPKGFFPQQDTGSNTGLIEASQDVSFSEMMRLQQQVTDVITKDPDIESWGAALGGSRTLNTG